MPLVLCASLKKPLPTALTGHHDRPDNALKRQTAQSSLPACRAARRFQAADAPAAVEVMTIVVTTPNVNLAHALKRASMTSTAT